MKPENELSETYQRCKAILLGGWQGEYNQLAVCLGRDPARSGRVIGRLVRSFALRHPNWNHNNVVAKATGRPAYQ